MRVSIKSAAKNSMATGKTTRANAPEMKIEPAYSTWGKALVGFKLSGGSEETKGTGERGGVATTYDKQMEVVLGMGEIHRLFAAVAKAGINLLPAKEELSDAYLQLEVARKSLVAAFGALGLAIPEEKGSEEAEDDEVEVDEFEEDDGELPE